MINTEHLSSIALKGEIFFSRDYAEARSRWLSACDDAHASVESFKLSSVDTAGAALSLDFAWVGQRDARNIIFHVAGTHGVEGFLGSAIQLAILSCLDETKDDCAFVFLHCLNPWGMTFLRRVTENNVDLNRNFQKDVFTWDGAPDAYKELNSFLNPAHPPRHIDLFLAGVVYSILKYGFAPVKQAIAGGQHEFERGLFFGGKARTENIELLSAWAKENLAGREKILGLEVHSGLGPFAYDTLFSPLAPQDPQVKKLERILEHPLSTDDPETSVGYETTGDLMHGIPQVLSGQNVDWILQEFGTYNIIKTLKTFRNENMHQHFGGGSLDHWSKQSLFEGFCPAAEQWRRAVIRRGVELFAKSCAFVAE